MARNSSTVVERTPRSAGILLHISSLAGRYGIGDLGPEARQFVDLLAAAGQTWWQILPLTPPGNGNSPYQSYSAFAGNPLLISPDDLRKEGLLRPSDCRQLPSKSSVDFLKVEAAKQQMLTAAWSRFQGGGFATLRRAFERFRGEEAPWLDDYALFTAIRQTYPGGMSTWPAALRRREAAELGAAGKALKPAIDRECFIQFLFARQSAALKCYANDRGVRLIGDIPIFVSGESADVWTQPHLFKLHRDGRPKVIAGVPPDAFSKDGQLWGNPLYDWAAMEREGYGWWIRRLRKVLEQCDVARIDHFRGFAAAWEVPAGATSARGGRWVRGPGAALFTALEKAFGRMPVIAEDLGLITPDVIALRDQFSLPGMRVLQFAFGSDAANPHLPHNFVPDVVAYTGTHDNDTTKGWHQDLARKAKDRLAVYAGGKERSATRTLMRLAWQSVANMAIAPLQDVLDLGSAARMNTPGVGEGNWGWRLRPGELQRGTMGWLRELTAMTGRLPAKKPVKKAGRRKG